MDFIKNLFSKPVTLRELKIRLKQTERERKRRRRELRKIEVRRNDLIERMKTARREGSKNDVDYLWEDFKQLETEAVLERKRARIADLEGITLKKYIYALERLEKREDRDSINKLIQRIRTSGLEAKLAAQDLDDQEYLDELSAILEDVGLEVEVLDEFEDDPEKAEFMAGLDAIIEAEEGGSLDEAESLQEELNRKSEDAERDPA